MAGELIYAFRIMRLPLLDAGGVDDRGHGRVHGRHGAVAPLILPTLIARAAGESFIGRVIRRMPSNAARAPATAPAVVRAAHAVANDQGPQRRKGVPVWAIGGVAAAAAAALAFVVIGGGGSKPDAASAGSSAESSGGWNR